MRGGIGKEAGRGMDAERGWTKSSAKPSVNVTLPQEYRGNKTHQLHLLSHINSCGTSLHLAESGGDETAAAACGGLYC